MRRISICGAGCAPAGLLPAPALMCGCEAPYTGVVTIHSHTGHQATGELMSRLVPHREGGLSDAIRGHNRKPGGVGRWTERRGGWRVAAPQPTQTSLATLPPPGSKLGLALGRRPHEAPRPEAPAQIRALREIDDDRSWRSWVTGWARREAGGAAGLPGLGPHPRRAQQGAAPPLSGL